MKDHDLGTVAAILRHGAGLLAAIQYDPSKRRTARNYRNFEKYGWVDRRTADKYAQDAKQYDADKKARAQQHADAIMTALINNHRQNH